MSDQKTLLDRLAGTLGIEEGGGFPGEAMRQLFDIDKTERLVADGDAASTLANTKFWSNPHSYPVQLLRFAVNVDSNVAGHATNIGTVEIYTDDGAGGTPVLAASVNTTLTTGGGNWVAGVDEVATLTAANCVVAAGANIFYKQTKGASGVAFPIRTFKARFRRV